MTDVDVVMNYPKRLSSNRYYDYRIGAYRYREIDPWQIQYQPSNDSISGLYMSVVQSRSNDVAVGTYSCEVRSDNNSLTQIMAFGIYRNIYGKDVYLKVKLNMSRSLIMYRNTWPCYASKISIAATFKSFELLYIFKPIGYQHLLYIESLQTLRCLIWFLLKRRRT